MNDEWECTICGGCSESYDLIERHVDNVHGQDPFPSIRGGPRIKRVTNGPLSELSSYGTETPQPDGTILHGCAGCGRGFQTAVEMGLHMLTECEAGPKMSREELLDAAPPTQSEIDETLASIAEAIKE